MKYLKAVFVTLPYIIFAGIWINHFKRVKDQTSTVKVYRKLKKMVENISKQLHVEYQIEGQDKLRVEESYLIVPNHRSILDPFPFFMLLNDPVSFICKKEISRVPILNDAVELVRGHYLDRGNLRQEMKTMRDAQKQMNERNVKLVIFPEGTRTKNEDESMNMFKPGAFKHTMAIGKKIYPVCISGTNEILSKHTKKNKYVVKVKVLDPLTKDDYESMSTTEVAEEVQRRIQENLSIMEAN